MATYKIFKGTVKQGKFTLDKQEEFKKAVNDLKGSKNPVQLVLAIGNYEELITKSQWAYYWGYVTKEISIETGHAPKELNKIFEHLFLGEDEKVKDLSGKGFHNFLLQIIALMAEMNITIHYADEVMIPNYKELADG